MLYCELIHNPSPGSLQILKRKIHDRELVAYLNAHRVEAVGLIQGQLAPIMVAADIAEKAANVKVAEIAGSCPQHITMIAVFGSTSAVKVAIEAVKSGAGRT